MLLRSGRVAETQQGAEGKAQPSVPLQAIQKLTLAAETEQPKSNVRKIGHGNLVTAGAAAAATAATVAALSTSAAAASSSSSSSSVVTISPPLRLPLALMPSTEVAFSRVVDTDKGPLRLLCVHADPLIVRVPSFLAPSEIRTLLDAVTAESPTGTTSSDGDSSSSVASAVTAASPSQWERYKPYQVALGRDAISDIATMSKRELRCMPSLYPLLDTIAARVARLCQANVTCISSLKEMLRYEPGQEFRLHKVRLHKDRQALPETAATLSLSHTFSPPFSLAFVARLMSGRQRGYERPCARLAAAHCTHLPAARASKGKRSEAAMIKQSEVLTCSAQLDLSLQRGYSPPLELALPLSVMSGGGTIFPVLPGSYRSAADAGTLLLFRNVRPNSGQLDARTAHRAEPTTLGRKFVLQCYVTEKKGNDSHWD